MVRKPTGQNLSDLFGKYSSLKDVSNTCGTVANKPNVPTRPKAGELLLLSGQNWAPSDCQICSTSVGIGQIGPGAIFGSIAETNILLVICSNAVINYWWSNGVVGLTSGAASGVLGLATSGDGHWQWMVARQAGRQRRHYYCCRQEEENPITLTTSPPASAHVACPPLHLSLLFPIFYLLSITFMSFPSSTLSCLFGVLECPQTAHIVVDHQWKN